MRALVQVLVTVPVLGVGQAMALVPATAQALALALGPVMEQHKEFLVMGIRQEAMNADCLAMFFD